MQAGIVGGTGALGRGLAARLAAAGVPVLLGSRDRDRAYETARALQHDGMAAIEAVTNGEAIERSDPVFLAVPFSGVAELLAAERARFRAGVVVVDVIVPLVFTGGAASLVAVHEGSAAEFVRARLPPDVRLASAVKTIPASELARMGAPLDCDDFVCGDSPESRAAAIAILERIPGVRLLDVGGLEAARTIERMTALAIAINKRYRVRAARFRVVGV